MFNQIKSNIRSRVYIFFLIILLIYTSVILVQEISSDIHRKTEKINSIERKIFLDEENSKLLALNLETMKEENLLTNKKDISIYENYKKFNIWIIEERNKILEAFNSSEISFEDALKYEYNTEMLINAMIFNLSANPEENRPLFEEAYSEELNEYNEFDLLKNLPFNSGDLYLSMYTEVSHLFSGKDKESNIAQYNIQKLILDKYFYNLSQDSVQMDYKANPWNYLYKLFSDNKFFIIGLNSLIIVTSLYFVLDGKNTKSKQLLDIMPLRKDKSIWIYWKSSVVSILILLVISIGIPFLILGMINGFDGLKNGIYVFDKGFHSFKPYNNIGGDNYFLFGVGKLFFEYEKNLGHNYILYYLPTIMTLYPLWKFLLLNIVLGFMKIMTLSLVGVSIGLFFKRESESMLAMFFILVLYIISQLKKILPAFNFLSMDSAWNITLGHTSMTWLSGMVILVITSIIIVLLTKTRLKNIDL